MKKKVDKMVMLMMLMMMIKSTEGGYLPPNTTGYGCNATKTRQYPCEAYVVYRPHSDGYLDLAAVGDLFGVSRIAISVPSNISSPLSAPLVSGQPLFVPIHCSCNSLDVSAAQGPILHSGSAPATALSYANISRTIADGDTFYIVSTEDFQNLTTYQSVMLVNPNLVATNLSIGAQAIFPIFCRCPDPAETTTIRHFVSYVLRPSDTLASVAAFFGVSVKSIVDNNVNNVGPSDTIFVPVSRLPNISQPNTTVVSPPKTNDNKKGVISGLAAGLGVTGFLLVLVCAVWFCRERTSMRHKKTMEIDNNNYYGRRRSDKYYERGQRSKEMEESLMADVSGCLDKYRVFGIEEIEEATDGFHKNCLVQGSVYKGVVNGQVLAIKKMNWNASEELKILQKVNHGNLVKLEGFCIDPSNAECFLIYEFVENGSLDSWLHGGAKKEKLSWKARLRIAVDVANGLQYIHEHTRPKVVHKDVKSSNILLDSNMRAKIANFGLAKSGCNAITTHIVGTQGYIAPEYLRDGIVSTKMDVFSFGVVLLELVSGREVVDEKGQVLWASAAEAMEGFSGDEGAERTKRVREFVDRSLIEESCSMDSLSSVMSLALACTHIDPSKRPSMVDIVYALCRSDEFFSDFSDDTISSSQVTGR